MVVGKNISSIIKELRKNANLYYITTYDLIYHMIINNTSADIYNVFFFLHGTCSNYVSDDRNFTVY